MLMVPELDVEAATELAPAGEMPDVELGMGRKDVGYAEPLYVVYNARARAVSLKSYSRKLMATGQT